LLKKKRDGSYRASLSAQGYSQASGEDFMENFSPLVKDSSLRFMLFLIQKFMLKAWDLDEETAFLNGNLDEEIFMKALRGFKKDMTQQTCSQKNLEMNKTLTILKNGCLMTEFG
jgi:Reverse transcriptase (RNA-dependent DNA polymerase)